MRVSCLNKRGLVGSRFNWWSGNARFIELRVHISRPAAAGNTERSSSFHEALMDILNFIKSYTLSPSELVVYMKKLSVLLDHGEFNHNFYQEQHTQELAQVFVDLSYLMIGNFRFTIGEQLNLPPLVLPTRKALAELYEDKLFTPDKTSTLILGCRLYSRKVLDKRLMGTLPFRPSIIPIYSRFYVHKLEKHSGIRQLVYSEIRVAARFPLK